MESGVELALPLGELGSEIIRNHMRFPLKASHVHNLYRTMNLVALLNCVLFLKFSLEGK